MEYLNQSKKRKFMSTEEESPHRTSTKINPIPDGIGEDIPVYDVCVCFNCVV
jgi:hypothetical protein